MREILARVIEEGRVVVADGHFIDVAQPRGEAAPVALAADVRSGTQDTVHVVVLEELVPRSDVVLALEVPLALGGLVLVPVVVGEDGVEAHGLGHLDALVPVLAGDALRVHLPAEHGELVAIKEELARVIGKLVRAAVGIGSGEGRHGSNGREHLANVHYERMDGATENTEACVQVAGLQGWRRGTTIHRGPGLYAHGASRQRSQLFKPLPRTVGEVTRRSLHRALGLCHSET